MKIILTITAMLSLILIAGCQTPDTKKNNLEGTWLCEKIWDGAHLEWDSSLINRITFAGDSLTIEIMDEVLEGRYVLHYNQSPIGIDLIYNPDERDVFIPAILSISNQTLTICHFMDDHDRRPLSFEPESGMYIGVYKKKN